MAFEGLFILAGEPRSHRLGAPGVPTPENDLPFGHVVACRQPEARLAGIEGRDPARFLGGVIGIPFAGMPQVTVAGVQEHAISFGDGVETLLLDHRFDVLVGDDAGIVGIHCNRDRQSPAPQGNRIEQHRAAHEPPLRHVLDTQWSQAVGRDIRVFEESSVVEIVSLRGDHADMPGAVELGADLANLGGEIFVVVDQLLSPERTARGQSRDGHTPPARAEGRCVLLIYLTEGRHFALLDHLDAFHDRIGCRPVDRPGHVLRPPHRWRPFLGQRCIVYRKNAAGYRCQQHGSTKTVQIFALPGIVHLESPPLTSWRVNPPIDGNILSTIA